MAEPQRWVALGKVGRVGYMPVNLSNSAFALSVDPKVQTPPSLIFMGDAGNRILGKKKKRVVDPAIKLFCFEVWSKKFK